MLRAHTNVYALPEKVSLGPSVPMRDAEFRTLVAAGGFLATLPRTFEQAQQRLSALPRCDIEPDGFFLVTGHEAGEFWRLNGHLNEYQDHLHRVELNGECPEHAMDSVLRAIGWPEAPLAFELVREGVALDEAEFRRYATGA